MYLCGVYFNLQDTNLISTKHYQKWVLENDYELRIANCNFKLLIINNLKLKNSSLFNSYF